MTSCWHFFLRVNIETTTLESTKVLFVFNTSNHWTVSMCLFTFHSHHLHQNIQKKNEKNNRNATKKLNWIVNCLRWHRTTKLYRCTKRATDSKTALKNCKQLVSIVCTFFDGCVIWCASTHSFHLFSCQLVIICNKFLVVWRAQNADKIFNFVQWIDVVENISECCKIEHKSYAICNFFVSQFPILIHHMPNYSY